MCYFSRLFVIQLKIKIPQTNNCNFDFYVTLNFTEYILWIKHKPQIKYQYILLVDSTFYHILFSDSSECRNNMFKDQFVCCLPVIICSVHKYGCFKTIRDFLNKICRSDTQCAVDSPKKRTDEFDLFAVKSKKANKTNLSVRFLGESMAHQSAFEIN